MQLSGVQNTVFVITPFVQDGWLPVSANPAAHARVHESPCHRVPSAGQSPTNPPTTGTVREQLGGESQKPPTHPPEHTQTPPLQVPWIPQVSWEGVWVQPMGCPEQSAADVCVPSTTPSQGAEEAGSVFTQASTAQAPAQEPSPAVHAAVKAPVKIG